MMEHKKTNKTNKGKKPTNDDKKPIPSITQKQIHDLLKEVMAEKLEEKEGKREVDLETISATLEEFLRSFIIIGYNLENEPIYITNAKTQIDADALQTAFSRIFFMMNNNGGL